MGAQNAALTPAMLCEAWKRMSSSSWTIAPDSRHAARSVLLKGRPRTAASAGATALDAQTLILSDPNAQPLPGTAEAGVVTIGVAQFHTADFSRNLRIELTELLRGIQLFNANQFYCDASSEDGYTIIPAGRSCAPHSSDYRDGVDWSINLTELLRLIQLFNVGLYVTSSSTEDGFDVAN